MDNKEMAYIVAAAAKARNDYGLTPHLIVPEGFVVEDLEHLMPTPARARGVFEATTPRAWEEYVSRYASEQTVIFCEPTRIVAVLNGHGRQSPGWCDHIAVFRSKTPVVASNFKIPTSALVVEGRFSQIDTEDNDE
jgi:uncharacterized protein YfdQ (DUF2303 family)